MPVTGLVVLTAAVSGTFYGPTATAFAGGDEMVLKKWDLSSFARPGIFSDIALNLAFSGAWDTGDPLQLYWFPTLTLASNAPAAGMPYGFYRSATGLNGSDPWITPGDGVSTSLKFFTADASFLNSGAANSATAGIASATVVPEPATAGLLLCGAAGWLAFSPRRRGESRL